MFQLAILFTGLALQCFHPVVATNLSSGNGVIVTETATVTAGGPPPWVRSCFGAGMTASECSWANHPIPTVSASQSAAVITTAIITTVVDTSIITASTSNSNTLLNSTTSITTITSSVSIITTPAQAGYQSAVATETPLADPRKPNMGTIVGAAMGVSIGFIGAILIIVFLLWRRRQHRRSRNLPVEKSASDRDEEDATLYVEVPAQGRTRSELQADHVRSSVQELQGSITSPRFRSVGGLEELPACRFSYASTDAEHHARRHRTACNEMDLPNYTQQTTLNADGTYPSSDSSSDSFNYDEKSLHKYDSPVSPETHRSTATDESNIHPVFRTSMIDTP